MNQRIKELYKQARGVRFSVDDFVLEPWEQEFARLIIQECVDLCESGNNTQTTCGGAAILIRQKFGIHKKLDHD